MTATRDLVTIGQQWRRVKRGEPNVVCRIRQVHRADKQVELEVLPINEGLGPTVKVGARERVGFTDLRKHWRLVP